MGTDDKIWDKLIEERKFLRLIGVPVDDDEQLADWVATYRRVLAMPLGEVENIMPEAVQRAILQVQREAAAGTADAAGAAAISQPNTEGARNERRDLSQPAKRGCTPKKGDAIRRVRHAPVAAAAKDDDVSQRRESEETLGKIDVGGKIYDLVASGNDVLLVPTPESAPAGIEVPVAGRRYALEPHGSGRGLTIVGLKQISVGRLLREGGSSCFGHFTS